MLERGRRDSNPQPPDRQTASKPRRKVPKPLFSQDVTLIRRRLQGQLFACENTRKTGVFPQLRGSARKTAAVPQGRAAEPQRRSVEHAGGFQRAGMLAVSPADRTAAFTAD